MSDNTSKWKLFSDGVILYSASGVGQNLGTDLEKNIADEMDALVTEAVGDGFVTGMVVSAASGLSVDISAGTLYVSGQRIKTTAPFNLPGLTPSTTLKVFVSAGTPFNNTNHAWPAVFGFTAGALSAGQILIATITTSGVGVTGVVDARVFVQSQPGAYGTLDDSVVAAASATSINQRLSMVAYILKALSGGANWFTAPVATIVTIWGKFHASTGHAHTGAANDAPKLAQANTHESPDTDANAAALHHTLSDGATTAIKGTHSHSAAAGEGAKLAQANTHQSPDTDTGTGSLHHTIGVGANQAAAGNHGHTAAGVTNTPAGGIAATDVQAALNELDAEMVRLDGSTIITGDQRLKKSKPAVRWIGSEGSAKDFQVIEDTGVLKVQVNTGSEGSPTWLDVLAIDLTNKTVLLADGYPVRTAMPQPPSPTLTPATTGGTLVTGTYFYKIVAIDAGGNLSQGGVENSTAVTGPTGKVTLAWAHVPGAVSYRVYRGTVTNTENVRYTAATNSMIDTGAAGTSESPSATNVAFANVIAADGDSWITGNKRGVVKNLTINHQLRADTFPEARMVAPVGAGKYAT